MGEPVIAETVAVKAESWPKTPGLGAAVRTSPVAPLPTVRFALPEPAL